MTKELNPNDAGHDIIQDDGRVLDLEQEVSSEKMAQLNSALTILLEKLPPTEVQEEDGWTTKTHEISLEEEGKIIHLTALTIAYGNLGVVQRPLITIDAGRARSGFGYGDDFRFRLEDLAFAAGDPLTIDETGTVISGSREVFSFTDTKAIEERKQELLDDLMFEGLSRGVTLPNLQTTPSGEIYQDGVVIVKQDNPLPETAVRTTLYPGSDDEASVHRRRMAAWERACKEVGSLLTNERADRVIAMLTRLSSRLES